MDETENVITAESETSGDQATIDLGEREAPILPDGWDGKGDFFDESSWSKTPETEQETGTEDTEEQTATPADDSGAPTTGEENDEETGNEQGTVPTTDATAQSDTPRKLKFTAKVDHNDVDVEVDESELPTLYQKAQVADRAQARLQQQATVVDRALLLAKGMGYNTADEMLAAAAKNYRDAEVDRLINDPDHPVHPDVAADIVDRRLGFAPLFAAEHEPDTTTGQTETEAPAQNTVGSDRDFKAEVAELAAARPQLLGKQLPPEVMNDAVINGKRVLNAYLDYETKQLNAENARLAKENKALKQNAESASRAPVKGVTGGGATDTSPEDPFLKGFNSDY